MAKKRATQADVALRAGVSQSTVSQILSGQSDDRVFKDSTRQKVLDAAKELGYAPSILARALRTNQSMTLGVVVGWITDELSLRVARGIQGVAQERGYSILIGDTEHMPRVEARILDDFKQHQVDGVIFIDSWIDQNSILDDEEFPASIFINLRNKPNRWNCVAADHLRAGYEATRHLLDLGYRPVAHISGPDNWESSRERLQGYRQALEDYGLPCEPDLIEEGDWRMEAGIAATNRLLDRRPDIRAIFVANDYMASGCIHVANRRGLRIPQDLALVAYDDRRFARLIYPSLTSLALPLSMMGQKAAHLLIDRLLHQNVRRAPSIVVPGTMVIRQSCGALSKAVDFD